MNLDPELLGAHIVRQLQETQAAAVLVIGKDVFTRHDLAGVECFNFLAARRMTAIFKTLQVPDTRYVYNNLPPEALALPHMGVVSIAVLGAAFEAKGIGGETPLASWAARHARTDDGKAGTVVTFHTYKEHARKRDADKPRRRRRRR